VATKDQFFASMSHEMRTPLFSVLSYLDLVLQSESTLDAEQRDFLESAQSSGKLLTATLDSVLDKAKASAAVVASAPNDRWGDVAASVDLESAAKAPQQEHKVCDTIALDCVCHCLYSDKNTH